VVNDEKASIRRAIEFFSGANQRAEPQPKVYVEMRFFVPAGRYTVWVRGKSDINSDQTDSSDLAEPISASNPEHVYTY